MADYESSGLVTSDNTGASANGTITLPAAADCAVMVVGGYNWTSDTPAPTLDSATPDDSLLNNNSGDGSAIYIWESPTTGSSINWAISGFDAGDAIMLAIYGISSADATEIAATGFPATATSTSNPPSEALTTATDDLCVDACEVYDTTDTAGRMAPGAGQTEVLELHNAANDTRFSGSYEKATTTTTTMSQTPTSTESFFSYSAAVVPTAAAAGTAVPVFRRHYQMMQSA